MVLEFDKNGFEKYWIDENNPLWGYSLWKRENKNTNTLVTKIPQRFKKHFNNINLTEKYKKVITV